MNEPSVFLEMEGTLPRDTLHHIESEKRLVENREVHNIYGALMSRATWKGLYERNEDKNDRPFLLTRSFFAGS